MSESLVGSAYVGLSNDAKALVDSILGDTVGGDVQTTSLQGGGTLITGTGAGGVVQGVVLTTTGQAVTAELSSGSLQVGITLPAGLTMAFEGLPAAVSPAAAKSYLNNLIAEAFGSGESTAKTALLNAVSAVLAAVGGDGTSTVKVNVVFLSDSGSSTGPNATALDSNDVSFKGQFGATDILAFVMGQLSPGKTLVIENVASAVIIGNGTVRLEGNAKAAVAGDLGSQNITGNAGNDTLVGGGGNDTLTGGSGTDFFGVNVASGTLVITDFNIAEDKLTFGFDGIDSFADLAPFLTDLSQNGNDAVATFGDLYTITFVGVSASDLTTNILNFDLL
jgi:Ca2+-binding RTX toxin-like protein